MNFKFGNSEIAQLKLIQIKIKMTANQLKFSNHGFDTTLEIKTVPNLPTVLGTWKTIGNTGIVQTNLALKQCPKR